MIQLHLRHRPHARRQGGIVAVAVVPDAARAAVDDGGAVRDGLVVMGALYRRYRSRRPT
jgi:hypothetical protein